MKKSYELLPEREEEMIKSDDPLLYRTSNASIWTPLSRGFFTGQYQALVNYAIRLGLSNAARGIDDHYFNYKFLQELKLRNMKLRLDMLGGITYKTASLGVYELLTEKLRSHNNGRPLSLYQEACCGLTSGAAAAFVWRPFMLASSRTAAQNWTYENLFSTLYRIVRNEGVLTLWRGSGLYISTVMAANMGMLASYNRSLNYLLEFENLHEWNARLSASIISGFFAAACSHPCRYFKNIKDAVQKQYHGGEKHAYRNITHYIHRVLTPHSGFKFYSRFFNSFQHCALFCMAQWWIYEEIRKVEWLMEDPN